MRTLPQVTGPTERALGALLDRELAGAPIPDGLAWVCLNLAAAPSAGRPELEARLDAQVKCGPPEAAQTVEQLVAVGLLDSAARLTAAGQTALTSVRERVRTRTETLVAGMPEDELETTIRVLDRVRARAESMLSS